MAVGFKFAVELFGQLAVDLRVGGVVVVEGHAEVGEIALVAGLDPGDEGFRAHPGFLGRQHDRRAMGVVRTDKMHRVAFHPPCPHPDVGLDVTDQMAQVQRAVGVREGGGDKGVAGHGRAA